MAAEKALHTEKLEHQEKEEGGGELGQDLGSHNIKQFLRALVQVMVQSNSSSPFAEQFQNSSKLCQLVFKVSNIVL